MAVVEENLEVCLQKDIWSHKICVQLNPDLSQQSMQVPKGLQYITVRYLAPGKEDSRIISKVPKLPG